MSDTNHLDFTALSAALVVAYVSNNSVSAHELPGLITRVHDAFAGLSSGAPMQAEEPQLEKLSPAQVRKSITPDALISFVDGKPYKSLKRHLGTHGLSVDGYRAKYGLPSDYPTVAPNYSAARSALAKSLGLGNRGYLADKAAATETVPEAAPEKPKRGTRSRKSA